jgi:hypothetical protein
MRRRVADFGDQPAERRQPTALIQRSRATETQALSDQPAVSTTIDIEIEVQGRWDALALSELLIPFHSFLVQHDHERWVVHARAPGRHGELLPDAIAAIEDWRAEGDGRAGLCRVGGHAVPACRCSAST